MGRLAVSTGSSLSVSRFDGSVLSFCQLPQHLRCSGSSSLCPLSPDGQPLRIHQSFPLASQVRLFCRICVCVASFFYHVTGSRLSFCLALGSLTIGSASLSLSRSCPSNAGSATLFVPNHQTSWRRQQQPAARLQRPQHLKHPRQQSQSSTCQQKHSAK